MKKMFAHVVACIAVSSLFAGIATAKESGQTFAVTVPNASVGISLSAGVHASAPTASFIRLHIEVPSGRSVREPALPSDSILMMTVEPVAPGGKTRTEWMVSEALPQRPNTPAGRQWLVRETRGVRVYAYRTRFGEEPETHVFTGGDGSLVGVELGYSVFWQNKVSRRYKQALEVRYQYARNLDPLEMDETVLRFLDKNMSIVGGAR